MACIKVIIANHQPFVCSGIRTALSTQPDLLVVGEAKTKQDTRRLCLELEPKILLLDHMLVKNDCHALLHLLKNETPELEVIILFDHEPDGELPGYFTCGVKGCLMNDEEAEPLIRAVHAVASGDTWFSSPIVQVLMRKANLQAQIGEKQNRPSPLSRREKEIMCYVAAGMSNQEIARELTIAERTVRHHVEQIMIKLSVPNRTKAVVVALKNDWITV